MKKMKYMKYKLIGLFLLVAMYCQAGVFEVAKEFQKTINKEFPITADGEVAIHNKYGKVDIHTGDFNKVNIKITITVDTKNAEKADELFERISVDFSHSESFVKAVTNIESKSSSWFNWGSNSSGSYKIDYDVEMPIGCSLDLKNKYGHSYVDNLRNDADFEIKYGNLKTEDIAGDVKLTLGYGKGNLGSVHDLKLLIKYSQLEADKANNIFSETKYSGLNFSEVGGQLDVVSKYDKYTVGSVGDFEFEGKYGNIVITEVGDLYVNVGYTDIIIDKLQNRGIFEVTYGKTEIDQLNQGFDKVSYQGKYTDLIIDLDADFDVTMELENKYGSIKYPEMMTVSRDIRDGNHRIVRCGTSGAQGKGSIAVDISYGNIKIR
jgi:hypothetical protein